MGLLPAATPCLNHGKKYSQPCVNVFFPDSLKVDFSGKMSIGFTENTVLDKSNLEYVAQLAILPSHGRCTHAHGRNGVVVVRDRRSAAASASGQQCRNHPQQRHTVETHQPLPCAHQRNPLDRKNSSIHRGPALAQLPVTRIILFLKSSRRLRRHG